MAPITIRGKTLRNRVIMGSMHTRLENEADGIQRQLAFYAERAAGGVGMIVTGGYSPNWEGRVEEGAPVLDATADAGLLRPLPEVAHRHGALMLAQILHAGRYARHPHAVGASALKSPIHPHAPRALASAEVERTIEDFAGAAQIAREAGFDGIELMGSEGYLVNQFVAPRTNNRDDEWGGTAERRMRFPIEVVRRIRQRVGTDFIVMYRISALDLVEGGSTDAEISRLAMELESAGADLLNTGIGWHEAKVPTVAYFVPRGAWIDATRRLKDSVSIPVVASNRINMPDLAEGVLSEGNADLIQMARPFLADPEWVRKAAEGRSSQINTCIACNQACLDFIFREKVASCLVNPRAGRETEFAHARRIERSKRIAVVGAGAAGLTCAIEARARGHDVTLYEGGPRIGGQLNYACEVPDKQEFRELIRYFSARIEALGVRLKLNARVTAASVVREEFDEIVVATGVNPRIPQIPGIESPIVVSYPDLLSGRRIAGRRVAVIGAGGIGFDVSAYLLKPTAAATVEHFLTDWGVDISSRQPGGLVPTAASRESDRDVHLLQRSPGRFGGRLGVSTGWILREECRRRGLHMIADCTYVSIDDDGIELTVQGHGRRLDVDTIVMCAGQESEQALYHDLVTMRRQGVHLIGGAEFAGELDALRAIDQGYRLAQVL